MMREPVVYTQDPPEFLRWYRRLACHLVERPWLLRAIAHEAAHAYRVESTPSLRSPGGFQLDEHLRAT